MTSIDTNMAKDLGNTLFNASLTALAVIGTRYASKSMGLKDRPIELKPKSVAMLAADIGAATYMVTKLQNNNVIPKKIFT